MKQYNNGNYRALEIYSYRISYKIRPLQGRLSQNIIINT